jgi:RNA polymerase sigma-70 factor (ECF subfamily)
VLIPVIGFKEAIDHRVGLSEGVLDSTQALNAFLADVERRAYRRALIATANREDALDIVQEAMMRLARHYADRDAGDWAPLFQRILSNAIMDWHRRQKARRAWDRIAGLASFKRPTSEANDGSDGISEEDMVALKHYVENNANDAPSRELMNERAMQALDGALNMLPIRQQQAFLLRAWEGLSVEETAHAMNCSQGSVKTHYSRAVHALRERLEDHRQ